MLVLSIIWFSNLIRSLTWGKEGSSAGVNVLKLIINKGEYSSPCLVLKVLFILDIMSWKEQSVEAFRLVYMYTGTMQTEGTMQSWEIKCLFTMAVNRTRVKCRTEKNLSAIWPHEELSMQSSLCPLLLQYSQPYNSTRSELTPQPTLVLL